MRIVSSRRLFRPCGRNQCIHCCRHPIVLFGVLWPGAEPNGLGGCPGTRPKILNSLLPPYLHHIGTPPVQTREPPPPKSPKLWPKTITAQGPTERRIRGVTHVFLRWIASSRAAGWAATGTRRFLSQNQISLFFSSLSESRPIVVCRSSAQLARQPTHCATRRARAIRRPAAGGRPAA